MKDSVDELIFLLLKSMPAGMKIKTFIKMLSTGKDRQKKMSLMKEINARRHFVKPREEIPWNPSIDNDKCNGCGVCMNFCPKKVFITDEITNKPEVMHPSECVFLCDGCVSKCKNVAISFPDKKFFVKYIYFK